MISFENETVVCELGRSLSLTTIRVRFWNGSAYQAMRLEDVTYLAYISDNNPGRLYTGIICAALFFTGSNYMPLINRELLTYLAYVSLAVGIITFLLSIKSYIKIASSGGTILAVSPWFRANDALEFIQTIEKAIDKYRVESVK